MIFKMGLSVQALALLGAILFSNISVTHQQVIRTGLQNATFDVGDRAGYLVVDVDPSVTDSGQWSRNGTSLTKISGKLLLLTGTGVRQLVVYNVEQSDAGLYLYSIRGESTSAYLSVLSAGLSIDSDLQDTTVVVGGTIVLRTTLSRSGVNTGTWTKNGVVITSSSAANIQISVIGQAQQLMITNAQFTDGGQYSYRVDSISTAAFVSVTNSGTNPVNGSWSPWSEWMNNCPATCTTVLGTKTRSRTCNNPLPQNGGQQCSGPQQESAQVQCTQANCRVDGQWSNWGNWGGVSCSQTCGTSAMGTRQRSRQCTNPAPQNGGSQCPGSPTQTESASCTSLPSCTGTVFVTGLQNTTKEAGDQVYLIVNLNQGGLTGMWYKDGVQLSNTGRIQIAGIATNPYLVITGLTSTDSGRYSFTVGGETTSAYLTVTGGPINGQWSNWGNWGGVSCSQTCGTSAMGTRQRSRQCTNPSPQNGGSQCPGSPTQTEIASCTSLPSCSGGPINGGWSNWGNWGEVRCSQTCGTSAMGTRERSRQCTNPSPQNGGSQCSGSSTQTESASCTSLPSCSVFVTGLQDSTIPAGGQAVFSVVMTQGGLAGTWSKNGVQLTSSVKRQIIRSDTNPILYINDLVPADTGRYDFTVGGETTSSYLTVTGQGPTNGGWSQWSLWSSLDCSQTCGTSASGVKNRNRTCTNPRPQNGGADCQGSSTDYMTDSCVRPRCPIDGAWSEWGQWGNRVCPPICGPSVFGNRTRSRYCNNPPPQFGGSTCQGPQTNTESVACGTTDCKVDGGYSQWSNWNDPQCHVTCGENILKTVERTRTCNNPPPSNGGLICRGPPTETQTRKCRILGCQVHGNVTQWTEWMNHTCSATCGAQATRTVDRRRTCTNPKPQNGGTFCTSHLFESLVKGCGLPDCQGRTEALVQWNNDYWYIGAIGAAIAIGVVLIILIIVCCVCHCRKDRKHHSHSDRVSSCEMDVLPPNQADYVTRGKYFDQNLNRSPDIVKN